MRAGERNLMLLFLALSAGATVLALGFRLPEARQFPLITGLITTALILGYFVVMAVPALREPLRPYIEDDIFMKISAAAELMDEEDAEEASEIVHPRTAMPEDVRRRRELRLFGYLTGFGVLAWVAGLMVAVPVFLFVVMVFYAGEGRRRAAVVTVATSLFLYFVFVSVLRLPPHFGLLGGGL